MGDSKMIPRFQGNAIQDEKGWYWEMFVSIMGCGHEAQMFITHNRFATKDEALKNLVNEIQCYVKHLANEIPELNINPDQMIDMKTNQLFTCDNKDKH
jgi:hypothetical protein